jgi:hypothetical protein
MLPSDSTLTEGQIAAMDHFDDTLKFCLSHWYNDKTSLVLSDNIQDLYGLALSNYFQHSLEGCIGGAIALTTVDDGTAQKTVVHMPKRNHPHSPAQHVFYDRDFRAKCRQAASHTCKQEEGTTCASPDEQLDAFSRPEAQGA